MSYKVFITPFFERRVKKLKKKYKNIGKDLKELLKILEKEPKKGIFLFDNLYKIRVKNSDVGGKRGGYRVIYYLIDEEGEVYLLTIYSKKEKEDISKNEILNILAQI